MAQKELSSKEDALRRFKIIEGHLKKVINMIEEDTYCVDVLQQSSAIRGAIRKAEEVILKNHINHCVVGAVKANGNGQAKAIDELMAILKKVS